MEKKLDKILEEITEIKVSQAKTEITLDANTKSLEEHIKRTNILEKKTEELQKLTNKLSGVWYALTVVGVIIVALQSMGILNKLFN